LGALLSITQRREGRKGFMTENEVGKVLVDTAVQMHRELGPGLLESVYEVVLAHELRERGLHVERQVKVPLQYKGIRFDEAFRADMVIENKVIAELKCVEALNYTHHKQILSYLKIMDLRLGFLLNFNNAFMKDGIKRIANDLPE
jgi:GxxExxY protein